MPIERVTDQITAALKDGRDSAARWQAVRKLTRSAARLEFMPEIDQRVPAAHQPETIALAATNRIGHLIAWQRAKVLACEERDRIRLLAAKSSARIGAVDVSVYQEVFQGPIELRLLAVEALVGSCRWQTAPAEASARTTRCRNALARIGERQRMEVGNK